MKLLQEMFLIYQAWIVIFCGFRTECAVGQTTTGLPLFADFEWRNETSDCGNESLIETTDYIQFTTTTAAYFYLNGYYYKDDSQIYGLYEDNNPNTSRSDGCDESIECSRRLRYAGTYVYVHQSGIYFMYEVPSDPLPRVVISASPCSSDYIIRSNILPGMAFGGSSWVAAMTYESEFNFTAEKCESGDDLTWCGQPVTDENGTVTVPAVVVREFCDYDSGIVDSCLAPGYTLQPTIDISLDMTPTFQPTAPTVSPTLPTREPTSPTLAPSDPSPAPTMPTPQPVQTEEPTRNPAVSTAQPTISPTYGACPAQCDSSPCNCTLDEHCDQCHSSGCSTCESGYFKKDYDYPCTDCEETFGKGCEFCQDFNGCGQCDFGEGFTRRYCDSCGLWYCTPECYKFTEAKFDEQFIIGENKFVADLSLSYEDVGCTNVQELSDIKVYVLVEHSDVSSLEITLEHEGHSVVVQACDGYADCQGQANEDVLISTDLQETNNNTVCGECQASPSMVSLLDGGSYALQGVFAPSESLDVFKNTYAFGDWSLSIQDAANQDGNAPWIYEYSIHICPKWN